MFFRSLPGSSALRRPASADGEIFPSSQRVLTYVQFAISDFGFEIRLRPISKSFIALTRNVFRGNGLHTWDASLMKDWKFSERVTGQFRAEIFNLLNQTQYGNPQFNGAGGNVPFGAPGSFGASQSTPDVANNNPALGSGGPRVSIPGSKHLSAATRSTYTALMRRLQLRVNECVVLRQIAEEDAEELSALIDRNRAHLREWLPWLDNSNGIHDTARFIGRSLEQAADDNGFTFAIVCDGVLTGVIGQHYLDSLNRRTELGYWLDALHQGRGIVTQSTARLTDYAFTEQACNRVILHCAFGNLKSRAVAERLGFVQEGILREAEWLYDHYVDLVVYSMLKSHWVLPPSVLCYLK